MELEARFTGSLLGLALGDALGARHEGGRPGMTLQLDGAPLRWTDDTEMAMGLTRSLAEKGGLDEDHLAKTWAEGADFKRGYGGGARRLLERIRQGFDWRSSTKVVFPQGSYGNGAAMRAAPLGLFFKDPAEPAARAASITHAHPLGVEGGVLIARATAMALNGELDLPALREGCREPEFRDRLLVAGEPHTADQVRAIFGAGVEAHRSATTAVHVAHRFHEFLPMMEFIVSLGGDVDTIGAMAGAIFGARQGIEALPAEPLSRLEERAWIEDWARRLLAARPS
ncbi:MAG TPA: ADP-ribosylglycohydrolase family protein [Planctomycetota bacterium]